MGTLHNIDIGTTTRGSGKFTSVESSGAITAAGATREQPEIKTLVEKLAAVDKAKLAGIEAAIDAAVR